MIWRYDEGDVNDADKSNFLTTIKLIYKLFININNKLAGNDDYMGRFACLCYCCYIIRLLGILILY